MLNVLPDEIDYFSSNRPETFCLIVPSNLKDTLKLGDSVHYKHSLQVVFESDSDINHLIQSPELAQADMLFIPYGLSQTRNVNLLSKNLSETQRFMRFNCCKTPIDLDVLSGFIDLLHLSSPKEQASKAKQAFQSLELANSIEFFDGQHNTTATLTFSDDLLWTESYAEINGGQSFVFPGGEIALTHKDFLNPIIQPISGLNGELTFKGVPILHRVVDEKFLPQREIARIFAELNKLKEYPIIVTVKKGIITQLTSNYEQATGAIDALTAFFTLDERLRIITEIGFGLNSKVTFIEGNTALNESYSANGICVHYGLGGPQTLIHFDVIVPTTEFFAISASEKIPLHSIQAN